MVRLPTKPCVTYLPLAPGRGVGPVHSQEVPLPLTRDYFEALTLNTPNRASRPLSPKRTKGGNVVTGTDGVGAEAGAEILATTAGRLAVGPFQMMS